MIISRFIESISKQLWHGLMLCTTNNQYTMLAVFLMVLNPQQMLSAQNWVSGNKTLIFAPVSIKRKLFLSKSPLVYLFFQAIQTKFPSPKALLYHQLRLQYPTTIFESVTTRLIISVLLVDLKGVITILILTFAYIKCCSNVIS